MSQSDTQNTSKIGANTDAHIEEWQSAKFFKVKHGSENTALEMDCLTASFRDYAFAPHTHETFTVGVILQGCETFMAYGERWYVGHGDVCALSEDQVHDGAPATENGFHYRASWPSHDFLKDLVEDTTEKPLHGCIGFPAAKFHDPELFYALAQAHRSAELFGTDLESDERLLYAYSQLVIRHAVTGRPLPQLPGHRQLESKPIAEAMAFLDAHYGDAIDLQTLAQVAGIPRTRLIRAMKRETGMTPHAWLTNRRVQAAQSKLRQGEGVADVATHCGFCDQSHLNRAFKSRLGITPGAYRNAHI